MKFLNWLLSFFKLKAVKISADEIQEKAIPNTASGVVDIAGALKLIQDFEGFRAESYLCPANVWTIGYGRTEGVKPGQKTTREVEMKWLLEEIMQRRLPAVQKLVKVPLTNNEINALISFVYNVGVGAFERSTMRKLLNQGVSREAVANEFDRWNKAGGKVLRGLVRRRTAEKKLFLTPDEKKLA